MNSEKVKNYSKNSLNQYTAMNSRSYSYDVDGNLLSDGTRIFTWDKKNRMEKRSTFKSSTVNDKDVRRSTFKGLTVNVENTVCNCITSGTYVEPLNVELLNVFAVKPDGEGIVGMVRYLYNEGAFSHYQRLYYLYDTLGSVAQVTAENGLAVQENLYTPYGEAYNTAADSVNGLRFVGRYGGYTDDDVKLTYFWHRWYDSSDGRWVSRDPIGVEGGVNLYGYVGNRAVRDKDCNGLQVCPNGNCKSELPTRMCDGKGNLIVWLGINKGTIHEECTYVHENKHIVDLYASDSDVCTGKAAGYVPLVSATDKIINEINAYDLTVKCYERLLEELEKKDGKERTGCKDGKVKELMNALRSSKHSLQTYKEIGRKHGINK